MDNNVRIEPMRPEHGPAVLAIYEAGIATGNASFETQTPDWPTWDSKHLPDHRFVALENNTVRGWIAASPTSDRCVYTGVVEESIYIEPLARGRGIGVRLMETLIASTEAAGIWTLQSGVFPENEASLKLHTRCGFRVVGVRERIGQHDGRWRDVLFLERRSEMAGT
ncbi:MAG TPA: GNAT family N-acetyltransferase [Acidothermaceae bacterium]|jgi:phosphinothricin acetyltransferase